MNQFNIGTYDIEHLLRLAGRVDAFADYVRGSRYPIERRNCAELLGFELEEKAEGGADEPVSL